MGASKRIPIQNGTVLFTNQLLLHLTCCRKVYFAQIFDFSLIPNMSLACMLGPCGQKKASFCRNLLLCHFPKFSSLSPQLSLSSCPTFLQGNGLTMTHWYLPFFFQSRQRVRRHTLVRVGPAFQSSSLAIMVIFFSRPYSFCRRFVNLPGLYLFMKGGLTPWGEFQDLSRGILVRSCKISKSTAMPLVRRISLAFHNNSWAKRCTLLHLSSFYTLGYWSIFLYKMAGTEVPCVPPTAVSLLTWTFTVLVDAASRTHCCIDLWSYATLHCWAWAWQVQSH